MTKIKIWSLDPAGFCEIENEAQVILSHVNGITLQNFLEKFGVKAEPGESLVWSETKGVVSFPLTEGEDQDIFYELVVTPSYQDAITNVIGPKMVAVLTSPVAPPPPLSVPQTVKPFTRAAEIALKEKEANAQILLLEKEKAEIEALAQRDKEWGKRETIKTIASAVVVIALLVMWRAGCFSKAPPPPPPPQTQYQGRGEREEVTIITRPAYDTITEVIALTPGVWTKVENPSGIPIDIKYGVSVMVRDACGSEFEVSEKTNWGGIARNCNQFVEFSPIIGKTFYYNSNTNQSKDNSVKIWKYRRV